MNSYCRYLFVFLTVIITLVFVIPANAADSTFSGSDPDTFFWEGKGEFDLMDDEVVIYQQENGYWQTFVYGRLTDSTTV